MFLRFAVAFFVIFAAAPAFAVDDAVAKCDQLAASPFDKTKPANVKGVDFGDIDSVPAIQACDAALALDPENPRLMFQAARAHDTTPAGVEKAFILFKKAAGMGHILANYSTGVALHDGAGVHRSTKQAMKYYRVAADAGFSWAMNEVGKLYQFGDGTEQNFTEAVKWYQLSVNLGDGEAMNRLAGRYEYGEGVAIDLVKAGELNKKSAEAGYAFGMNDYAVALQNGKGVAKDMDAAIKYFKRAADMNNDYAQFNLGTLMFEGKGVAKDEAGGFELFAKSFEANDDLAKLFIDDRGGNPADPEEMKTIETMLKWKGLIEGEPDGELDDESVNALVSIRDKADQ